MKSNFARTIFWILSSLLLVACGGGGSGGGEDGTGGGGEAPGYTQTFNTYLPLLAGSSIDYSDSSAGLVTATISKDADTSQSKKKDIYRIVFDFSGTPLSLLVESNPNAINLHGIDGPFIVNVPELGGDTEVDNIRLNQPIVIYDGDDTIAIKSITGTAHVSSPFATGPVTISLDYSKAETASQYLENGLFGDGDLPSIISSLNLVVKKISAGFISKSVNLPITTELSLSPGLGIVKHEGNYLSLTVESDISDLEQLPYPIWFFRNAGSPIAVAGQTFMTSEGNVDSTQYAIANLDEINELGWITVEEDTASNTFNVTMQNHADLPDTLTSVEVVFENRSTGERMSGNVTLLP
ncbi:MAG: hypothetical protein D9N11_13740 [Ketobacter sp.]|nr:MAG: hypothetical protein D9N11_13740 [Ketobacter sp.]